LLYKSLTYLLTYILVARYLPNVANDISVSINDRRTDRPTDLSFGKFRMAISPQRVSRPTSCLVLGYRVFVGNRGRHMDLLPVALNPRGGRRPSWKISNISARWNREQLWGEYGRE